MRFLLITLVLCLSCSVFARDIDQSTSGAWYHPDQSGHGFSIEVLPDGRMLLYWYVYNPDGTPTFLFATGRIENNQVEATVYHHSGMLFGSFDNSELVQSVWGTLTFTLHDCSSATIEYSSTMSWQGVPFGSGSISLVRLSWIDGIKCTESPLQSNYRVITHLGTDKCFGFASLFGNGWIAVERRCPDLEDSMVALGEWQQVSQDEFSYEIIEYRYSDDLPLVNVTGEGTFEKDGFLALDLDGVAWNGYRLASFHMGLTFSDLAGTYTLFRNESTVWQQISFHIVVTNDGRIQGTTSDDCTVDGQFNIPNGLFNQAWVELTLSGASCEDAGTVVGVAEIDRFDDYFRLHGHVEGANQAAQYLFSKQLE